MSKFEIDILACQVGEDVEVRSLQPRARLDGSGYQRRHGGEIRP